MCRAGGSVPNWYGAGYVAGTVALLWQQIFGEQIPRETRDELLVYPVENINIAAGRDLFAEILRVWVRRQPRRPATRPELWDRIREAAQHPRGNVDEAHYLLIGDDQQDIWFGSPDDHQVFERTKGPGEFAVFIRPLVEALSDPQHQYPARPDAGIFSE